MMINVVAILAYLIIHINILIFAVGSQIFIELSPILFPQHTHSLTLCVAKVLTPQDLYFDIQTKSPSFRSLWLQQDFMKWLSLSVLKLRRILGH